MISVHLAAVAALVMAGGWLLVTGVRARRPDIVAHALFDHPAGELGELGEGSVIDRALDAWDRRFGPAARERDLAVLDLAPETRRRRQALAVLVAVVMAVVLTTAAGATPVTLAWAIAAVPLLLLLVDRQLRVRAGARRAVIAGQVVGLAEFLALGTQAGLTAPEACGRALPHLPAESRRWIRVVTTEVAAGRPFDESLLDVAAALQVPQFQRLADTVVTATRRGTPLSAALLAQVDDIRAQRHAQLLQQAGRAEIVMLVPIVFCVMPAVVAVAVYPGLVALTSM